MNWYRLTVEDVLKNYQISTEGLSQEERQKRLTDQGYNEIEARQQTKRWKKIAKHFTDLLMIVLIIASFLKFASSEYIEGSIILFVVIVNGLVSYWQERKAEESLNGLKQLMGQEAIVLSNGMQEKIPAKELVKGDVIVLRAGDVVPADVRLIEVHDLLVEESILTGESEASEKNHSVLAAEESIGDQKNMAFSGTLVQSGSAVGVVVETGNTTEIGKINQALQSVEQQTTPLIKKINRLNKQIFQGILCLILFLVVFTTFRYGMDWHILLSAMIALVVSMVPEGLPAVLTMILSVGVHEMAKEKAIIKGLPSVETLGSMTVICSDKTGTLTKNEMTVVDVAAKEETRVLFIMKNCQELKTKEEQKTENLSGNPTELALIRHTETADLPLKKIEAKIPFSSEYKYMATMHAEEKGGVIYVKGAPEVLLAKSTLSSSEQEAWGQTATAFAKKGQRVLGFAYKKVDSKQELTHESLTQLTFAGIAGLIDPPKESAVKAVKECQQAGISVKMITGDHKDTAKAIAEQIGLKHTAKVLEGIDLDLMSEEELIRQVPKVDVFARTTPEHKLRIVKALQKNGEIVGMTGDGVNDAPALKRADIGIAMGIKGSEVSKQAADMVLGDDNFHTIAKAVKEGRRILDNLQKTINFFLPTALAQGLILIWALILNRPLPLSPVQILWVNMVTTITLSYALGFESPDPEIMKRPPRDPKQGILSGYHLFRIIYVALLIMVPAYLLAMQFEGQSLQQTILLQNIVLAQAVYMINCRELSKPSLNQGLLQNKSLFLSLGILALLQGMVIFLPIGQQLIGTVSLTMTQQLLIGANVILLFLVVEIEKGIMNKLFRKKEKTAREFSR
ncbi:MULTISPECIES: HAD-IC family P-type ATPase [Enterococcus]|uniref:HAD-IC family P-type ATPase n=1 Tax=Enterococcus TaxID=1350 RepID=UPI0007793C4D|nr:MULTISPECIES: HAD-IC family P-type ATPase [Enterococcus]AMP62101.1 ATPase [Enterococcus faecium]EMF0570971.1 HAD-IC family P-type ATPase [Enterococcus faecium]NTK90102.1 HAD-IC family P-type ATPase [Enterococcus faecium]NTM33967.1 HAD-IC family P-type ATPase [Enterococcus faecium]